MFSFLRVIQSTINKHKPLKAFLTTLFMLVLLCCLFAGIVYVLIEGHSFGEGLYQAIETFSTVGYGDNSPVTPTGKAVTTIFMVVGVSTLAGVLSAYVEWRQYRSNRKRRGSMDNKKKDSYIIFNNPGQERLVRLIEQVRSNPDDAKANFCIVDSRLEELPASVVEMGDIHFIRGGALEKETYERANVQKAKTVFVFPSVPANKESDGATAQIARLLKDFINNDETRVIASIVSGSQEWLFDGLNCTTVSESAELELMVQEGQDKFTASIISKLLKNTEGANPVTVVADKIHGITWTEFEVQMQEISKKYHETFNTFALVKDGISETCPKPDAVIEKGDYLSILCKGELEWSLFEDMIVKSM